MRREAIGCAQNCFPSLHTRCDSLSTLEFNSSIDIARKTSILHQIGNASS